VWFSANELAVWGGLLLESWGRGDLIDPLPLVEVASKMTKDWRRPLIGRSNSLVLARPVVAPSKLDSSRRCDRPPPRARLLPLTLGSSSLCLRG